MKGETENQLFYFVIDKAVQFLLQKFNCQDEKDLVELLYYALTIEFLRTVDGGVIYNSSGALKTATLAFKNSLSCAVDEFYCAKQVLSFYCEKIADKNCEPFYNDYNAIATTISRIEKKDFITVANKIIDKVNFINDNRAVAVRLIELIEKQVMLASKSFSEVYKIFRLNSDKKTYSKKSIKKYLTLCGYSGEQINLMTLLTETK